MFRSLLTIVSTCAIIASLHVSMAFAQRDGQDDRVRDHRAKSGSPRMNVRDHRGLDDLPVLPPDVDPPPPSTGLSDYGGPFGGQTRIDVREFIRTPTTASTFNIKSQMDLAWLALRGKIDSQIRHFFEKAPRDHRDRVTLESIAGRNLYDLNIQLADTTHSSMAIGVTMRSKSVELRYSVPDNMLKFKAEVDNFFDPTITIRSTMTVVVKMTATNDASQPLRVDDAYVELSNARASVDGNFIHDALENLLEFVKRRDFEREIAGAINGQRQDIRGEVTSGMALINQKLAPYAGNGAAFSTGFDRAKQQLVLLFTRNARPEIVDAVSASR